MKRIGWVRMAIFLLTIGLVLISSVAVANNQDHALIIGEKIILNSKVLGEDRPLLIYLPSQYEKSQESYPVFYLLDGGLHFHHVTGIIEFLSKYSLMPQMIVVAIPNIDRERDFLPTSVDNWPPVAASDKFFTFLKKELIPTIEKKYRVRPFRILCGHSHGGVFCIDSFLNDPDLFTLYICISPTLSWDDNLLLKKGEKVLKNISFKKKFLFLTTSADDEGAIAPTREFAGLLKKYSPKGLEWRYDYMDKDDHLSVVHPTIYNALVWLHQGWRLSETKLEEMTLLEVKQYYQKLSQRYGSTVPIPEGVLFNLGYSLLDHGDSAGSMEAFKYTMKLYPQAASGYVGLGEVYEALGELELARKYYQQGCERAKKENDTMVLPAAQGLLERVMKKISNEKDRKNPKT